MISKLKRTLSLPIIFFSFAFFIILIGSEAASSGWMIRGQEVEFVSIKGRVFDFIKRSPLEDYTVSMADSPGSTRQFSSGEFDFNGWIPSTGKGKSLITIKIEAPGFTWCERTFEIIPGQVKRIDDVFLIPMDPASAEIGPEGGQYQSSDGSVEIIVPEGALNQTATFRSADFPHSSTLPSPLPKSSHFTYCAQILPDVDLFNEPVTVRMKNDRGFAPGTKVPAGYYDPIDHQWKADGMATVTGDGQWVEYSATHLSPWDFNHPPPDPPRRDDDDNGDDDDYDDDDDDRDGDDDEEDDDDCDEEESGHSSVSLRSGVLTQNIPLFRWMSGTEHKTFSLEYSSRCARSTTIVGLNDKHIDPEGERKPLRKILEVAVHDFYKKTAFPVREGFTRYSCMIECHDDEGNWWPSGAYTGEMILHEEYPVEFWTAEYFGGPPVAPTGILADDSDPESFPTRFPINMEVLNLRGSPFGNGWTIGGLRRIFRDKYSPALLCNGTKKGIFGGIGKIDTIAGTGVFDVNWWTDADGRPAVHFMIPEILSVDMDPSFQTYILSHRPDWNIGILFRVDKKGGIWLTGGGGGLTPGQCDGKPATELLLQDPVDMEVDSNGNVYMIHNRFYCGYVDPEGIYHRVFMKNFDLRGIAVSDNGEVYYCRQRYVIKYDPVTLRHDVFAGGGGTASHSGNGLDALDVSFWEPYDVALDDEGSVYITDRRYRQIYKIHAEDNHMEILAGKYDPSDVEHVFGKFEAPALHAELQEPTYICLDYDRQVYFSDETFHSVGMIDAGGNIRRIAGCGYAKSSGDRDSAVMSGLDYPTGIHFDNASTLMIPEKKGLRVRAVQLGIDFEKGRQITSPLGDESTLFLDEDGGYTQTCCGEKVFHYNPKGLLESEETPGGIKTYYYYDENERLVRIQDQWGNIIRILYNSSGLAEEIISPGGDSWFLNYDVNGNLVEIIPPDFDKWEFNYDADFLMTGKKSPGKEMTGYHYENGRVTEIDPPTTGSIAITPGAVSGNFNDAPDFIFPDDLEASERDYPATDTVVDLMGNQWRVISSPSGLPLTKIDPMGNRTRFSYDPHTSALQKKELPEGNTYQWQYNTRGDLMVFQEPDGTDTTYLYGQDEKLLQIFHPSINGNTIPTEYFEHNTSGLLTKKYIWGVYPTKEKCSYHYQYDSLRRIKEITGPYEDVMEYHYDENGQIEGMTNFAGTRFDYERDVTGRIKSVESPKGIISRYTYDSMGNTTSITDGEDRATSISYNIDGLPEKISNYDGRIIRLLRDASGRITKMITSVTPENPYKPPKAKTTVFDLDITYERDASGRLTNITDPNGNTTYYDYDAAGRLIEITDPEDNSFHYYYNGNGDLMSYIDPLGYKTRYTRNLNRKITEIRNEVTNDTVTMTYIPYGNMIESRTFPDGMKIDYEYRPDLGQPRHRRNQNFEGSSWYDQALFDELHRITYSQGREGVYKYEYDADNRMTRAMAYWNPFTWQDISFSYDCCGYLETLTDEEGREFIYSYDAAGRFLGMETTLTGGNYEIDYHYGYSADFPERIDFPGGITANYTYTPHYRISSISISNDIPEILYEAEYEYDNVGNISKMTINGEVRDYRYDSMNRIVEVKIDGVITEAYSYDALGNRLSDVSGSEYIYDDNMRLISHGDVSWEYNENGHAIARRTSDTTLIFRPDWAGRLGEVELENGDVYTYYYETRDMRLEKRLNGDVVSSYIYTPYIDVEFKGGTTESEYIKNPNTGETRIFLDEADSIYFVHYDGAMRPVLITDGDGIIAWKAMYSTFGKATVDPTSIITYNWRLPGQYFDQETGLHYNQHRYYDPEIGRYIQPDPMMYKTNPDPLFLFRARPYVYARNNPLTNFDVTGLCDHCDECPGNEWETSQLGVDVGLVAGVTIYQVHSFCTSRIGPGFDHWIACFKFGLVAGGSGLVGRINLRGCSQAEAEANLVGWSSFMGGGIGPGSFGVGMAEWDWDNLSWSYNYGIGIPITAGYQHCWIID